jgi:hypothetical protein
MPPPRSKLPLRVVLTYWAKVRQLLRTRHGLSRTAAVRAIEAYQTILHRDGVRDEIYHAPVAETAKGIAQGGYAADPAPKSSSSAPRGQKEERV